MIDGPTDTRDTPTTSNTINKDGGQDTPVVKQQSDDHLGVRNLNCFSNDKPDTKKPDDKDKMMED